MSSPEPSTVSSTTQNHLNCTFSRLTHLVFAFWGVSWMLVCGLTADLVYASIGLGHIDKTAAALPHTLHLLCVCFVTLDFSLSRFHLSEKSRPIMVNIIRMSKWRTKWKWGQNAVKRQKGADFPFVADSQVQTSQRSTGDRLKKPQTELWANKTLTFSVSTVSTNGKNHKCPTKNKMFLVHCSLDENPVVRLLSHFWMSGMNLKKSPFPVLHVRDQSLNLETGEQRQRMDTHAKSLNPGFWARTLFVEVYSWVEEANFCFYSNTTKMWVLFGLVDPVWKDWDAPWHRL